MNKYGNSAHFLWEKELKFLQLEVMKSSSAALLKLPASTKEHFILRANAKGRPENITQEIDGIKYQAIKVADKIYIPNREARL